MATNLKKSLMTYPQLLVFMLVTLLIASCTGGGPNPGLDKVCISVPEDTSELGRKNHFIPKKSIKVYEKDFDSVRKDLVKSFPELNIPTSETFNKASIVQYFQDTTVVGLRFYYGIKPDTAKRKSLRLIIVGVDSKGNDVYLKKESRSDRMGSDLEGGLEYGQCEPPCPMEP